MLNKKEIQIKTAIMRRVYYVWFLRKLFSHATAKVAAFAIIFWQMSYSVSFLHVFNNLPGKFDVAGDMKYLLTAAQNTESTVQIYLSILLLLAGWIFMENTFFRNNSIFGNGRD